MHEPALVTGQTTNSLKRKRAQADFYVCGEAEHSTRVKALPDHPQQAESKIVAAGVGRQTAATRRPAAPGVVLPATAPINSVRVRARTRRALGVSHRLCWILSVPVLYPLVDVAVHIIQPPGIGLELPYWVGLAISVCFVPGMFAQLIAVVPKTVDRRGPGAACILPFGLRRQTVALNPSCLQPSNKFFHILPGDHLHGPASFPTTASHSACV